MWTDLLHYENKNWYDVTCQLITECLVALNQNSNKDFELNDYLGEKKKKDLLMLSQESSCLEYQYQVLVTKVYSVAFPSLRFLCVASCLKNISMISHIIRADSEFARIYSGIGPSPTEVLWRPLLHLSERERLALDVKKSWIWNFCRICKSFGKQSNV